MADKYSQEQNLRISRVALEQQGEIQAQKRRIAELEFALVQIAEAVKQGQYFKVAGMVRKALEGSDEA